MSHNFTKIEAIKHIRDVKGLSLKEAVDAYNNGTYTAADVSLWMKTRDYIFENFYPIIKEQRAFQISAMADGKPEYAYAIATLVCEAQDGTDFNETDVYNKNKAVRKREQRRGRGSPLVVNHPLVPNTHSPFDDL
jgi:hypothetical protein